MLMASHIYLALQSRTRPVRPAEWGEYLAGAVAPDVRYLAPTIPREVSHSWSLGLNLAGPFGAGYRHHLAVDQSFYRRCEERKGLGRLGAMNLTILAELYALRRLTDFLARLDQVIGSIGPLPSAVRATR